ncbi:MAG TPA: hypothetical protein PLE45_05715 [Spirochaetota bacterium]|nr:hypothetical protein [Spirochaetota bacterium]HOM39223.1 hypothetical protein [Spirochaetota bacterium]HPP04218.1 hypothetical protein [Spirochaetota bacterium]
MKKNILFLFLITTNILFANNKLPLIIDTQEKIFLKISKEIGKKLPENIEILVYDLFFINSNDLNLQQKINNNFYLILSSNQFINKYSLTFIKELKEKKEDIDFSFIENQNHFELISFGNYLKMDAVMISTITILENTKRLIWDKKNNKFIYKKIALIQSNIFNTETSNSLYRFSYYFLLD